MSVTNGVRDGGEPEGRCLYCGAERAFGPGDPNDTAPPNPGDIVVCIQCGGVMILDYGLALRAMTGAEMDRLLADHPTLDQVASAVRRIRSIKHSRG